MMNDNIMSDLQQKWIERRGQQVGRVVIMPGADKVYVTDRSQFFNFKSRKGFSISKDILHLMTQNDVKTIRVMYNRPEGGKSVYVCSLEKWFKEGETNFYKALDEQLFIPVEKFDKVYE